MAEGELSEYSLGKMLKNKTLDTNITGHGNPQLECIEFNQIEVCQPLNAISPKVLLFMLLALQADKTLNIY